ncbi:hypothetical protein Tco_0835903 [Tanacetum coccineum]
MSSPRSDLRWKPTGRILNTIGLKWVPTGKIFTSCKSKADSESTHGSKCSLSPDPQSQENVPQAAKTVTTSNELDLLFSLMFDELLNGTTPVVSKSSDVNIVDAPDKHQQQNTT